MAISYSINWCGPINEKWIKENGKHWAAGRIDVSGSDEDVAYRVAPMHVEDWGALSHWLDHHVTLELWSYEDLIDTFEKKCLKRKIRWWKDGLVE